MYRKTIFKTITVFCSLDVRFPTPHPENHRPPASSDDCFSSEPSISFSDALPASLSVGFTEAVSVGFGISLFSLWGCSVAGCVSGMYT